MLSKAAHNVTDLLNRKLDVPPIPVETIRKQDNNESQQGENFPSGYRLPNSIVEVYGIWKIFVEYDDSEINEAYIVISADNVIEGYKKGEWENIEYRGFYTTFEEAKNEINGYLE